MRNLFCSRHGRRSASTTTDGERYDISYTLLTQTISCGMLELCHLALVPRYLHAVWILWSYGQKAWGTQSGCGRLELMSSAGVSDSERFFGVKSWYTDFLTLEKEGEEVGWAFWCPCKWKVPCQSPNSASYIIVMVDCKLGLSQNSYSPSGKSWSCPRGVPHHPL